MTTDSTSTRAVAGVCPECGARSTMAEFTIIDLRAQPFLAEVVEGRELAHRCPICLFGTWPYDGGVALIDWTTSLDIAALPDAGNVVADTAEIEARVAEAAAQRAAPQLERFTTTVLGAMRLDALYPDESVTDGAFTDWIKQVQPGLTGGVTPAELFRASMMLVTKASEMNFRYLVSSMVEQVATHASRNGSPGWPVARARSGSSERSRAHIRP